MLTIDIMRMVADLLSHMCPKRCAGSHAAGHLCATDKHHCKEDTFCMSYLTWQLSKGWVYGQGLLGFMKFFVMYASYAML